jgi:hypothetical protein
MDTQNFINQVATGNAVGAKELLNDLLASRAFEALDTKKIELAQSLYGGEENLDVEVQDTADTPVEEE